MKLHRNLVVVALVCVFAISGIGCSNTAADQDKGEKAKTMSEAEKSEAAKDVGGKMLAVIDTSKGKITCELFPDKAPEGVANFVGLAEGTKEYKDPKTGKMTKSRFYDGLTFHRVIPGFMIQGGDIKGDGTGGPGYIFDNEVHKDLTFDRPGRLAYANRGPDTNGSQFFITLAPTPHLNMGYTIFGQVVEGQDVVKAIGDVKRDRRDKPLEPVTIKKVTIIRKDDGKK